MLRSFWLSDCVGSVFDDLAIIRIVADVVSVADLWVCGCRDLSGCLIVTDPFLRIGRSFGLRRIP